MTSATISATSGSAATDRRGRVSLADAAAIRIGPVLIEPSRRRLVHDDGRAATIEPRAMKVLVALARAGGAVLGRDALFDSCWDGRAVGDEAVDRAVARLRGASAPLAAGVFAIETVPKVGYRLVVSTTVPIAVAKRRSRPWIWLLLLVAAALTMAIAILLAGRGSAADEAPRIGILSFGTTGDDPLAAGVADQLRVDLARRSDLELVSLDRAASSTLADAIALGRRLDLPFIVWGRVERSDARVVVAVRLIETETGAALWNGTASGRVDEIARLQDRISSGIVSALGLRLMPVPRQRGGTIPADAQALYLTARGLLRARQPGRAEIAEGLLRRTVARAPGFAPAWAKLAAAVYLGDRLGASPGRPARQAEALALARHALRLDPGLAEAHGIVGMVEEFATPAAAAHIRRAALLDPNDPEILLWRGHVHGRDLDYAGQLASYRRAVALDPLWLTASLAFVESATELGLDEEAQAEIQRFANAAGPDRARIVAMRRELERGDISEAVRLHRLGADRAFAAYEDVELRRALADLDPRPDPGPGAAADAERLRSARAEASQEQSLDLIRAAKRLAAAGRGAAVAHLYARSQGLVGLSPRSLRNREWLLIAGPTVALLLEQSGRREQAASLRSSARAAASNAYARGRVPGWVHAQLAALDALEGRDEAAVVSLERAAAMGWIYRGLENFGDLAAEPAFASLRGQPRFEQLREAMRAHLARERLEIIRLPPAGF